MPRFVATLSLGLAAALVATSPVAAQASPAQASRVATTFSAPSGVTAGHRFAVSWNVTHRPSHGQVRVQRTFGTGAVYRTVLKSSRWSAKRVKVPADPTGKYSYRLVVLNGHRSAVAVSKPRTVKAYGTVSLGTILKSGTQTVSNNGTLFPYVFKSGTCIDFNCNDPWFTIIKRKTSQCRSMSLQLLLKSYAGENGQVGTLQVEQVDADAQQQTFTRGAVTAANFTLTGGSYVLRAQATQTNKGNGGELYLNGSASCYGTKG